MTVSYCNVFRRPLTGTSFFYLENILSLNMWPSMTGSFLFFFYFLFHNILWAGDVPKMFKSSIWHRLDDVHFRTEWQRNDLKGKSSIFGFFSRFQTGGKTKLFQRIPRRFFGKQVCLTPPFQNDSAPVCRPLCAFRGIFRIVSSRTWSNPFASPSCWLTGTTGTRSTPDILRTIRSTFPWNSGWSVNWLQAVSSNFQNENSLSFLKLIISVIDLTFLCQRRWIAAIVSEWATLSSFLEHCEHNEGDGQKKNQIAGH